MAMPSSLLWAVDICGRVYTLSTVGQYWELYKDTQLEFKRVSAVKQCCWGIACDHQVYTYVFSGDVPIRYQEETYENQVWQVQYLCDTAAAWPDSTSCISCLGVFFSLADWAVLFVFIFYQKFLKSTYMCQIPGYLLIFKFPNELHFPAPSKSNASVNSTCSVWAISDWSIHPFHWLVYISPFLSDKYTIPLRKCSM